MSTFCQNSFQFHDEAPLSKDLPYEPSIFHLSLQKLSLQILAKGPGVSPKQRDWTRSRQQSVQSKVRSLVTRCAERALVRNQRWLCLLPDQFSGQKLSDLYVLEVFAGTARLTRSLKQKGFKALAFDRTTNRSEGQAILETDLSNRDEVDSLLEFIRLKTNQIVLYSYGTSLRHSEPSEGKEAEVA